MKQQPLLRRRNFERVVFLVDVKVLLEHEGPRNCAAQIFNSVVTVLEKCNEHSRSSTVWGYVLFDSSRSPLASDTTIGRLVGGNPTRERFDGIPQHLEKFGKVLEAVVASRDGYASAGRSRADCLVRTLAAVASDFQWDPLFASDSSSSDEDIKNSLHHPTSHAADLQSLKPKPNLVIIFSSLPSCSSKLARFLDVPASPVDPALEEVLLHEFGSCFRNIQLVLDSKDIKCCWIDVPARQNFSSSELYEASLYQATEQCLPRRCLSEIAWAFVSVSLVANIINVIPPRLVWNMIAYLTPGFLDRRVGARCEAHVRGSTTWLRGNPRSPTSFFSVEVHCWSQTVLSSSGTGHLSRPSRLFGRENFDLSEISSTSDRVQIAIRSKMSRGNSLQLSTERYLVLQRREAVLPRTDSGKIESGDQGVSKLKTGEPSWPDFLISLESEGFVGLVTVENGGCDCQAILEPVTPNCALLTVLETAVSLPGRKHVPTRLSCHLSRVSKICSKEKVEEYTKQSGRLPNMGDNRKAGRAGVSISHVVEFEQSFDSTLLKVVKEKRRGCVLFRSVKKHRVEWGKTLDSSHDLFQGSTSEPEVVSWQEYWRRVVKRIQREHMLLDNNCTLSSSLGVIKSAFDLSSVDQFPQNGIHFQATGGLVEGMETVSDPGLLGAGSESATWPAVRPSELCISTPAAVGSDLHLSPTTSPDHARPPFSACNSHFSSSGDEVEAEKEVHLTPTPELSLAGSAMIEEEAHSTANVVGTTSEAGLKLDTISDTSPGYSFIEQLVRNGLTSERVDLHQFADSIVRAYKNVELVGNSEVVAKGTTTSETASSQTSSASVAARMKKLLLKRPKNLLSKYKELLASAATSTRRASIVLEKLKEHELQILFRLEILALDGNFHDEARQEGLTRDICQLLDNIQFHLVGENGSEESLQQYCHRVIVSRYKGSLPSTISKIFSAMELNGYCDPSLSSDVYLSRLQTSETQLSSEDVALQSEPEATGPSSDEPDTNPDQRTGSLSNRSLSSEADCRFLEEVTTSRSKESVGKENLGIYNALQDLSHKQEKKQRKMYHFSGGAHNPLRVKAVRPRDHAALKPRKMIHLSRSFAGRLLDHNIQARITSSTSVPIKEAHVLQDRGKDIRVVCQTPSLKERRL